MRRLFMTLTCLYCVLRSGTEDLSHETEMLTSCAQPEISSESTSTNERRTFLEASSTPPLLTFRAIDVNTNKAIDPLTNYDPHKVGCHHYGAYFLPHPTDCSSYYVCVFGHLLLHKCGRGTGWNYKNQLCEIRPMVHCYTDSTMSMDKIQEEIEAESTKNNQYSGTPPMDGVYTICYLLINGTAGPLTWIPQTETEIISTQPQLIHTPPTITEISSTGRVNGATNPDVPNCPKSTEAYLPHSRDCSKYYICIIGMPVLTSCPEGLYWDQRTEFCDSPSKVQCTLVVS